MQTTLEGFAPMPAEEEKPLKMPVAVEEGARCDAYGAPALSDMELLTLLVGSRELGKSLFESIGGSFARMAGFGLCEFRNAGLALEKRRRLAAMTEIWRRAAKQPAQSPLLNTPELVYAFMAPIARGLMVEKLWTLCLDRKTRLIRCCEVTSGTLTGSLVHPREVFRYAILEAASAVIVAHNHPSGDPAPSNADVVITRKLREAATAIDIELSDHVIIGDLSKDPSARGYYSFREAGIL